jgi:hypothetical protein
MKAKGFVLLSTLIATPLMQAQQSNATQYGQVFNNVSTVTGKALVLFGTERDQAFLKGMVAAEHKGTFICDNIDFQRTQSQAFDLTADSKFRWTVSGSTWPVNDTVVVCGTVTFKQPYRNYSVDTTFTFGAWGSAIAYPGVTQQVPALTFSYVDYCPQNTQNCETSARHPEPAALENALAQQRSQAYQQQSQAYQDAVRQLPETSAAIRKMLTQSFADTWNGEFGGTHTTYFTRTVTNVSRCGLSFDEVYRGSVKFRRSASISFVGATAENVHSSKLKYGSGIAIRWEGSSPGYVELDTNSEIDRFALGKLLASASLACSH